MQGFQTNSVSAPPNTIEGQLVPPTGTGGWGRDCAPGIGGTKIGADESNDLLGNVLRVLQVARVNPTANRYDDLIDALNTLYQGPSSDEGNVLLVGLDGKPLLTVDKAQGNLLKAGADGLLVEVEAQDVSGLAEVAMSGNFKDLSGAPEPYVLPVATTDTLGGIKAGPGTGVAKDGTIGIALSADAGNIIGVGSDKGLFVSATPPAPASDEVGYLRANGTPITRNVAWGMGGPQVTPGPRKVVIGASVTVGSEPFTLLIIAGGTYDIEMEQNWQWSSGTTVGNAAGSSINLMKFTLSPDLSTVQSITSMNVSQSLFANANTTQLVAQRSLFHDVVIDANPLVQYGVVGQFVNGQANQTAAMSNYVSSVSPSDGSVLTLYVSPGLKLRFTPKH
jgi:hypothetical protein